MKKDKFSTAEILKGIREGQDVILRYVYDTYFDAIEMMVLKNNGTEDLAKDIFQESLVTIYKMAQAKEFEIKQSSFFTFFYALSRNTLFLHYRSNKRDVLFRVAELSDSNIVFDEDTDSLIKQGLKERLFHKYFKSISEKCRKILQLFLKGFTAVVIAEKLNFTSDSYVRKRKKVCIETLVEMIKKDPISKELL